MSYNTTMQETDDLVRGISRVLFGVLIIAVLIWGYDLYKGTSSSTYNPQEERDFLLRRESEPLKWEATGRPLPP
tara:strand:- start:71 stop:292 length:222 start_codon:yes stop_codon:yes gene_type:complete